MALEGNETGRSAEASANIVPIPPALEFPFPSTASQDPESSTHQLEHAATSPAHGWEEREREQDDGPLPTPSLQKVGSRPRPRQKRRLHSDRNVVSQRASVLRMKRNHTQFLPTGLTAACQADMSADDLSSTDDEVLELTTPRLSAREEHVEVEEQNRKVNPLDLDVEERFRKFAVGNANYKSRGSVSKRDGRLNISLKETNHRGYLAKTLDATLKGHIRPHDQEQNPRRKSTPRTQAASTKKDELIRALTNLTEAPSNSITSRPSPPPMNIVVMVIGSRGDIQPFLKIGKLLKEDYGHRVRIATHPAFKDFVEQDCGLEFFSIGGDPAELMAFMVKNPGLMPSVATLKAGEVGRRRDSMFEMFQGFWRACVNATDGEQDVANLKTMRRAESFVADAIIANPPSFAHVHCAERLGVPLHLMFTFPYTPTQQFPHPLANIKQSNVDSHHANFMSYPLVEMMTWQGLGDLINRFRVKTLGLEPVNTLWVPGQLVRQKVPYTYLWSPGLIPKPPDWGPEIDLAGFVFLDLASSFKPPDALARFMEGGDPPVYIGFGSIVVDDPDKFTSLIFNAVKLAGVRALVSKGWGGLGNADDTPENIYLLENTPHDWLFPRCSAVIHHGGAGTTAIGLKCGKPTMIVPFFGDQPFWGSMVAKAGAGAYEPVPYKQLTAERLAEGIKQCLTPNAKAAAAEIAESIAKEGDGAKNAVESFHRLLPFDGDHSMRCSMLPEKVAAWKLKHCHLRLSPLAASLLVQERKLKWQELKLLRHRNWNDLSGPGDPIVGGSTAIVKSVGEVFKGVGGVPIKWVKSIKKESVTLHEEHRRRQSHASHHSKVRRSTTGHGHIAYRHQSNADRKTKTDGGHVGKESHLPESHALLGRACTDLERELTGSDEHALRPAPSTGQEADRTASADSEPFPHLDHHLFHDLAYGTGRGLLNSGEALAKAPMELALAVAQGFHNAPRLYGDATVRTTPRITGIQSGLRAAGSEFTFGVYDGVTGLVTQPYRGARENGTLGFVQGVGKGFGGFVLKDLAAIIAPFGYTMKGIHKEMIKSRQPTSLIRRARIQQGTMESIDLKDPRRKEVINRLEGAWRIVSQIRREYEAEQQDRMKRRSISGGDQLRKKK